MADRGTTRRRFLHVGGAVVAASVAGCSGDGASTADGSDGDTTPEEYDDGDGETTAETTDAETETETPSQGHDPWPTFAYDAANTGYVSGGEGPTDGVEVRWENQVGASGRPSGVESNPAVVDGTVYVGGGKKVNAFDAETGDIEWQVEVGKLVDASPAVDGDTVYVQGRDGLVRALSTDDGSERWSVDVGSRDIAVQQGSPTVVEGSVYVGSTESVVYSFDAATGDEEWRFEMDRLFGITPAVVDGTVYFSSAREYLYAVDAASGDEVWRTEGPPQSNYYSSPAVTDDVLYCGSYGTDSTAVHAYDAATGSNLWNADVAHGGVVYGSPAVDDDTVYVGSTDYVVYALDRETGSERWSFETDEKVYADPAVVGDTVYVGSYDNHVYALDAATGDERWSFDTGSQVDGGAAVVDGTAFVGSANGSVYALSEP